MFSNIFPDFISDMGASDHKTMIYGIENEIENLRLQ